MRLSSIHWRPYFEGLCFLQSRRGLVCNVSAYLTQKPGFVSQVSPQKKKKMKYEKYFFGGFLSADFGQKL